MHETMFSTEAIGARRGRDVNSSRTGRMQDGPAAETEEDPTLPVSMPTMDGTLEKLTRRSHVVDEAGAAVEPTEDAASSFGSASALRMDGHGASTAWMVGCTTLVSATGSRATDVLLVACEPDDSNEDLRSGTLISKSKI